MFLRERVQLSEGQRERERVGRREGEKQGSHAPEVGLKLTKCGALTHEP